MVRELRQHPEHRVRNGLPFCGRSGFDEIDHGFDGDSLRRVEEKLPSLRFVAAHLQESLERRFLE